MAGKDKSWQEPDSILEMLDFLQTLPFQEKDLGKLANLVEAQGFRTEEQVKHYLTDLVNSGQPLPDIEPETPLEQAQQIAYQAGEAVTRRASVSLAKMALNLSTDCADAYLVLAEKEAANLEETLHYLQAAVAAGKRAIESQLMKHPYESLWNLIRLWPYLRGYNDACFGLANGLWEAGKRQEAIGHLQNLLQINPGDPEGVRYVLASYLLELGDIAALNRLLAKYNDDFAWLYTKALVSFLEQGDSPRSRTLLQKAIKSNGYVVAYLTGRLKLPQTLPKHVLDEKSQAIFYTRQCRQPWEKTEGALEWLKTWESGQPGTPKTTVGTQAIPEVYLKAFNAQEGKMVTQEKTEVIYTFKVALKGVRGLWFKIDIKGSQTLDTLHRAIYRAFERYDEHMYAFFMSNKAWDHASEYSLPEGSYGQDATQTRIDSLGLTLKQKFLYIFDFGSSAQHSITLVGVRQEKPEGAYPRIISSKGQPPPQYPDDDEE